MKRKPVRAVGAMVFSEAEAILMFDKTNKVAEIIPLIIHKHLFEKMSWWNDPKAKKIVEAEISEGPFGFVVLFYEVE